MINILLTGKFIFFNLNRLIKTFEFVFPSLKRIIIDKKEEDLFKLIIENKGKKMVAVVNQIHVEGLEHHWCHSYGQTPRNMRFGEINPIGDMNLRQILFEQMYHVLSRDIKTSRARTTPASYSNIIVPYFRESNFQYEHRNM